MQVRSTRDSAPPVRYWERSVNSASLPRNSASESTGPLPPCMYPPDIVSRWSKGVSHNGCMSLYITVSHCRQCRHCQSLHDGRMGLSVHGRWSIVWAASACSIIWAAFACSIMWSTSGYSIVWAASCVHHCVVSIGMQHRMQHRICSRSCCGE